MMAGTRIKKATIRIKTKHVKGIKPTYYYWEWTTYGMSQMHETGTASLARQIK
jgi:hypothetical protein